MRHEHLLDASVNAHLGVAMLLHLALLQQVDEQPPVYSI